MPTSRRARRGVTLLESMATMTVVVFGILGVALAVLASSKQNRRNLIQAQAGLIAEQELERITAMTCATPAPGRPCANIEALDRSIRSVWWSSNGTPRDTVPGAGDPVRLKYDVAVDVDPPMEGDERGSPQLNRTIATQALINVVNVRVTVSWRDPDAGRRAVALQTRMSP
ncbi:type IV pilus modification PilV family protein [Corallococcus terminator]